jgi:predicted RNase H-like nuclease (RuvC/YqgF family)
MIRAMDDQHRAARERDALSEAYEERTSQLHDARAALAEAVSTLRRELEQRRAEVEALRAQVAELRDERDRAVTDNRALRHEVEVQRGALEETARLLSEFQHMKAVRWSKPLRGLAYRIRDRSK